MLDFQQGNSSVRFGFLTEVTVMFILLRDEIPCSLVATFRGS